MVYQIGYRRPPAISRFTKGKSGNPKGRPKGSNNFVTLLENELSKPIVVNENGRKKTITRLQAMVKKLVAAGLQGEPKSLLTLLEILRRTGRFEHVEVQSLLPDNYESILDAYVAKRQQSDAKKPEPIKP